MVDPSTTSLLSQHSRFNNEVEVKLEDYLPTPSVLGIPATLKEEQVELEHPEATSATTETKVVAYLSEADTVSTSSDSSQHNEDQVFLDPLESSDTETAQGHETASVKPEDSIEDADQLPASSLASPAILPKPSFSTNEGFMPSRIPMDAEKGASMAPPTPSDKAEKITPVLEPLIRVLRELRDEGMDRPLRSYIGLKLMEKDPQVYKKAGVTRFSQYITMAESLGIIRTGGTGGVGGTEWIKLALTEMPPKLPEMPPKLPEIPPKLPEIPPELRPLAQVLREAQDEGMERPLRSYIGEKLAKRFPGLYKTAGVTRFSQYITIAESSGMVEMGGKGGADWIKLRGVWRT
ncbi:hypothetical protein EST38_g1662 [Candolleomyces aberdarensis]|uniref:Uncharacterized protein n=1 Tax=Candolleomyces aberdarensis TaxID=2316362 RepID=A0A4Q2DWY6_9AGAR|nr:hypothetical protein EST38_g1662 [Candolleomyces aberdarensis]